MHDFSVLELSESANFFVAMYFFQAHESFSFFLLKIQLATIYFSSVSVLETLNISTRLRESVVSKVTVRRFYTGTCLHVSSVNFAVFIAYEFTGWPIRLFPWDLMRLTELIAINSKRAKFNGKYRNVTAYSHGKSAWL